MIKLVLSDMDETLKPAENKTISDRTNQAIKSLKAAGIAFGPATGRPVYDALPYLNSDATLVETGIFASGKVVFENGKLILAKEFSYAIMKNIFDVIDPMEDCLLTYFDDGPLQPPLDTSYKSSWKIVNTTQEIVDYLDKSFDTFVPGLGPKTLQKDTRYFAAGLLVPLNKARAEEIKETVLKAVPEINLVSPYTGWYDVNFRNWNKAQGFETLLKAMGLKPDEVVFCGDSGNDLDLLKLAPHSCCMENGTNEAKAAAKYLLPSVKEEGVAQLLEALTAARGDFESPEVQSVLK